MNFFELVKYRRSIRKYEDRQIPREDLERIIEAGAYAPNAGGGQRSMIVAIPDREVSTVAEGMYDVYHGDNMNAYRERFDKCAKCELLRFCRGCPAVAFGYTHNFYATDPQCWKS